MPWEEVAQALRSAAASGSYIAEPMGKHLGEENVINKYFEKECAHLAALLQEQAWHANKSLKPAASISQDVKELRDLARRMRLLAEQYYGNPHMSGTSNRITVEKFDAVAASISDKIGIILRPYGLNFHLSSSTNDDIKTLRINGFHPKHEVGVLEFYDFV